MSKFQLLVAILKTWSPNVSKNPIKQVKLFNLHKKTGVIVLILRVKNYWG